MPINFSAAYDRVNHQGILYGLCSVGIRGSVLSMLTQFLSNQSQHVMLDGSRSTLVDGVSGVPQGSVLGLLLVLLYTSELFSILETRLISYAADYFDSCCAISRLRVTVAESLIRDLGRLVSGVTFGG